MCGIHASISTRGFRPPSSGLKLLLCNRGPDHAGEAQAEMKRETKTFSLSFTSTVLALRGGHVQTQPFVDSQNGAVFCWNGEAWKMGSEPVMGNDGQKIFEALLQASSQSLSDSNAAVLEVLRSISGPFAFIFLDKIHGYIYVGRDRLGRRSLLYNTESFPGCMEFASTADSCRQGWKEIEADAIYQFSCSDEYGSQDSDDHLTSTSLLPLKRHPWIAGCLPSSVQVLGKFNRSLSSEVFTLNTRSPSVTLLKNHLSESLKLRIFDVPIPPGLDDTQNVRIAILFSGGLDCTVLARMAHDLLPLDQHIDLINVAFENPRVVAAAKETPKSKRILKSSDVFPQNTEANDTPMLLVNPTDLSPYESCPDRETGRKSFQELQHVCPGRVWRFIAVNIPYIETMAHRSQVVDLIHPHNTEMDLSIACALYFAARGSGMATSNLDTKPHSYTTPARVLLSGLGADELFGGYTRHATAFNRVGFSGLLDELELDVNRLGKRNLGRDDRIISHWGREARFPYLDESLVKWAVECSIWEKCGFQTKSSEKSESPDIEPGKKVLRLLAYELGMHSVAHEKKRAIQFGARTAKMEIGRTKGTALISYSQRHIVGSDERSDTTELYNDPPEAHSQGFSCVAVQTVT